MALNVVVEFTGHPEYESEMNSIIKSLMTYPNYKAIASSLGKIYPQHIVAAIVGCIIPESKATHTTVNKKEYEGRGKPGTEGWNCGEGLIQWTYWKYKLPLIEKYNADSRSTQKLPTTWEKYKLGTPIIKGQDNMYSVEDGQHIAGLSFDNQMLFLTKYYDDVVAKLLNSNETNLALIVAKIYQEKAGINRCSEYASQPIERAYVTAKIYYPSTDGNTYLQSVKLAKEYLNFPVAPGGVVDIGDVVLQPTGTSNVEYSTSGRIITPENISSINKGNKNAKRTGIVLGVHMKQK